MTISSILPVDRFLLTLDIVSREGGHLAYSWNRLYQRQVIDVTWVNSLETHPELAERVEAFISRFGRMQDTIADKLLPRWLMALAETPGSQIETLNRAERLGIIENVEHWLEARKLRNKLVHEYMESAETFAEDLMLGKEYALMLLDSFNRLREFAAVRMGIEEAQLPKPLRL
ncbi:hypothetical protein [Sedimenticola hydrogenitrophicus]|uniref:hypothetical protein n=1 Tax=Sedimenticola hydrogenitrophicus TaxID=2967975 RepID=UPI0023B026A8|nr:hypothetical protein [Sedimenticola hydrogenitrophicus]